MSGTYTLTVTLDSGKVWRTGWGDDTLAGNEADHLRAMQPFNPVASVSVVPGDCGWEPTPTEIWDAATKNTIVRAIREGTLALTDGGVFAARPDLGEVTEEFRELVADGYVEIVDGTPRLTGAVEEVAR